MEQSFNERMERIKRFGVKAKEDEKKKQEEIKKRNKELLNEITLLQPRVKELIDTVNNCTLNGIKILNNDNIVARFGYVGFMVSEQNPNFVFAIGVLGGINSNRLIVTEDECYCKHEGEDGEWIMNDDLDQALATDFLWGYEAFEKSIYKNIDDILQKAGF